MRVYFIHQRTIPSHSSRAIWQRCYAVSSVHEAWLITGTDPPARLPALHVVRIDVAGTDQGGHPLIQLSRKLAFAVPALAHVLRLRRDNCGPHCVYTFYGYDLILGAGLKFLGFRWVVDIFDLPELLLEDVPEALQRRRYVKAALLWLFIRIAHSLVRRADLVITTAADERTGFAQTLISDYKVRRERLLAIPNGVDPRLIVSHTPIQPPGPEAGLPLRLVYVGGVTPHHGMLFLLDVVARVQQYTPVTLSLIGRAPGTSPVQLRSTIEALGLGRIVQWLGEMSHDDAITQIDDAHIGVYAFPQRCWHDGAIPIKVGEYMARGKPVLASDLTGVRSLVEHGRTGCLLPPGDVDAWVAALVHLASHPEERQRMGEAAIRKATHFAWPDINGALVRRLERAVHPSG